MKTLPRLLLLIGCCLAAGDQEMAAQLCNNNTDSLYGLNSITGSSGQIVAININDAGTATIGSPAPTSQNANGLAFCSVSSRFYFFNQCGSGTTEFVSFDPLTGSKVPLAVPTPAIPTTQKIRSGCMTSDGFGYYTIFPGATTAMGFPQTNPALFYYSVGSNTWILITQQFHDTTGNTINELKTLNSGDMTIDGSGNLWIVASNSSNYALYRISGPLPTTAQTYVTADTIVPLTPTPAGISITGIAFNSTGHLYLSTGSYSTPPGVAGNNQLYEMTSPSLPLNHIGTLPNGYGDDLTSCAIPLYVLPLDDLTITVRKASGGVLINWTNKAEENVSRYETEYSTDGRSWTVINSNTVNNSGAYQFFHYKISTGMHYYRLGIIMNNGARKYSAIRQINNSATAEYTTGPNPTDGQVIIHTRNKNGVFNLKIMDINGRILQATPGLQDGASVNLDSYRPGIYIFNLIEPTQKTEPVFLRVIKQ